MKVLFLCTMMLMSFITDKWLTIGSERVELVFNSEMQSDDLDEIKTRLAEVDITIDYVESSFNENGYLTSIDFQVDCNDGYSGSASSKKLTSVARIGFYRDYHSTESFGTGTIR